MYIEKPFGWILLEKKFAYKYFNSAVENDLKNYDVTLNCLLLIVETWCIVLHTTHILRMTHTNLRTFEKPKK